MTVTLPSTTAASRQVAAGPAVRAWLTTPLMVCPQVACTASAPTAETASLEGPLKLSVAATLAAPVKVPGCVKVCEQENVQALPGWSWPPGPPVPPAKPTGPQALSVTDTPWRGSSPSLATL